ncbi:MAG: MATE family efflux transporter [Clostridiales bacterium]|nr:MATE family efflux transporter [Clostridiales bacterium]
MRFSSGGAGQIDFSKEEPRKSVARAVVPLLVADILALLYSVVDRIYIGRMPGQGADALGGIGLCFPFVMMVTAFTNLFGQGGAPLTAMARGRSEPQKAREVMNTAFMLLSATSLVLLTVFELFAEPILFALGGEAAPQLLPHALSYLRLYLIGTPAAMLASGLAPYINAQGYARAGMLVIAIGAVANILLDPLFIFVFDMGVRGAALATVLSQILSVLFVVSFLRRKNTELRLSPIPPPRIRPQVVMDILGLGVVNFIMQFTNSLVAVACNRMLATYGGAVYISVYTVISSVRQILDVPVQAIGSGGSPVLSFHYGARRPDRMRETVRLISLWGIAYTAAVWLLILVAPGMFIRIFNSDPDLIRTGAPALRIYFAAFVFQALQYSGQTVFRSIRRVRKAIFFSLLRKVILVVPLTILLPPFLGASGVFLAEPISNFLGGGACFLTMMLTEYRKWGNLTYE